MEDDPVQLCLLVKQLGTTESQSKEKSKKQHGRFGCRVNQFKSYVCSIILNNKFKIMLTDDEG